MQVPFLPGRTDASPEQTDVDTFAVLEPTADGFRNYLRPGDKRRPEELLIDRASLLDLTAPEMTALVGGLRVLGANAGHSGRTASSPSRPGSLTNDFFVNLLEMGTEWRVSSTEHVYEGRDREHRRSQRWTGTAVDLIFGSHSSSGPSPRSTHPDDGEEKFVTGLRGSVGQGHEPRPFRPAVSRCPAGHSAATASAFHHETN